jgi:hypothetical protein
MTKEYNRFIECSCGGFESFPADEQRHHSQFFEFVEGSQTDDNNATYKCPDCSSEVKSFIAENENEEE